jgi:Ca-activated chloride channel family protein
MNYAYPHLFGLSIAAAVVAVLAGVVLWRKRRAVRQLSQLPTEGTLLAINRPLQVLKAILLAGAALLLGLVLLGPQWGQTQAPAQPERGRDVLVILDVSRSMLAEDVAPNRLEHARRALKTLANGLASQGGYRIGLIAFADRAVVLCPLTFDYRYFQEELARISLATLRLRGSGTPEAGTQIGAALRRAQEAIDKEQAAFTDVLLLSDGGDMDDDTLAEAELLAKLGVPVHTVGIGDAQQGALIPVKGPGGQRTFLKYRGELVRTKLEEEVLRHVAERTRGRYLAAGTGPLELERTYREVVAQQPVRELMQSGQGRLFIHRFQWFLAPALALLLLEMVLGDGRRQAKGSAWSKGRYFPWVRRQRTASGTPADHI